MSKKKIDPSAIEAMKNELTGASHFFSRTPQKQAPEAPKTALEAPEPTQPVSPVLKPENQPKGAHTRLEEKQAEPNKAIPTSKDVMTAPPREVNRPVNQSIDRPVDQLSGEVVERPVAFYIPKVINERIEEAIIYMQKRHGVAVDRSALVSAILGNPTLWEPESLNELVERTVNQLTSRLTSRLTRRLNK